MLPTVPNLNSSSSSGPKAVLAARCARPVPSLWCSLPARRSWRARVPPFPPPPTGATWPIGALRTRLGDHGIRPPGEQAAERYVRSMEARAAGCPARGTRVARGRRASRRSGGGSRRRDRSFRASRLIPRRIPCNRATVRPGPADKRDPRGVQVQATYDTSEERYRLRDEITRCASAPVRHAMALLLVVGLSAADTRSPQMLLTLGRCKIKHKAPRPRN